MGGAAHQQRGGALGERADQRSERSDQRASRKVFEQGRGRPQYDEREESLLGEAQRHSQGLIDSQRLGEQNFFSAQRIARFILKPPRYFLGWI